MPTSYTSKRIGPIVRLKEYLALYATQRVSDGQVARELDLVRADCTKIKSQYGIEVSGKQILEVGPGQFLLHARYLALRNQVTVIDTEVISEGFSPGSWVRMARVNGLQRLAKTFARKLLGIDRAYRQALRKQLGQNSFRPVKIVWGDVSAMGFEAASFDLVYCRSVMHHVPEPEIALRKMADTLKPGGIAYVVLHLYTSYSGSLDSRVIAGDDSAFYWAHLRPSLKDSVSGSAILNKLSLAEWRRVFALAWPGSIVEAIESSNLQVPEQVDRLIAARELDGYSREELVSNTVIAMWQKPAI